jgi:glucose 1-dehydrogenase
MDLALEGKSVLITGGERGIGRAIAEAFAEEKASLAIADIEPSESGASAAEQIASDYGVPAVSIIADISQESDVRRMVETTLSAYGKIDVFVNVAGVLGYEPVTKITQDEWSRVLDTNLTGAMFCCREVCRHMIANNAGSIVIISSTIQYSPAYREAAYRVSKTGLQVFAETVALEMAPFGIRVNTVSPGIIYSEHWSKNTLGPALADPVVGPQLLQSIPAGRVGTPEDIGHAVVFMASDKCPYITGANLVVDGGFRLRPLVLVSQEEIRKMNQ